jgi:hypothetical protein
MTLNGEDTMKLKLVSAAAVFLFAALSAFAQNPQIDDIVGVGTTNYVPVFTGSHRIGNSLIYQTGGKIGIGTTAPGFPVHILRNSLLFKCWSPYSSINREEKPLSKWAVSCATCPQ